MTTKKLWKEFERALKNNDLGLAYVLRRIWVEKMLAQKPQQKRM